jgi:hypothetical protein
VDRISFLSGLHAAPSQKPGAIDREEQSAWKPYQPFTWVDLLKRTCLSPSQAENSFARIQSLRAQANQALPTQYQKDVGAAAYLATVVLTC